MLLAINSRPPVAMGRSLRSSIVWSDDAAMVERRLFLVCRFLKQCRDACPELTPRLLFCFGEPGQRLLVTHFRQVDVLLPEQKCPLHLGARLRGVAVEV